MRILALDTATAACSVALWYDGTTLSARQEPMARGHAEALPGMIEEVMAEAGNPLDALNAVAVTVGPGAFTGLRIGLAMARGLGLALDIPVLGASTLECLAAGVTPSPEEGQCVLALIETKRGDFYAQAFGAGGGPPGVHGADALHAVPGLARSVVLVGDGAASAAKVLTGRGHEVTVPDLSVHPRADVLAQLAADRGPEGCLPPDPLYLRPPEAKVAAHGGRLRP